MILKSFFKFSKFKHALILQYKLKSSVQKKVILKPLLTNLDIYSKNIAIVDNLANSGLQYQDIFKCGNYVAKMMSEKSPSLTSQGRNNKTVCFLCANDASYVSVLLACWINGNIAVPLCKDHPSELHEYFLKDSQASLIVSTSQFLNQMQPLAEKLKIPLLKIAHPCEMNRTVCTSNEPCEVSEDDGAAIIYTSGTTGPPKGVLLTHNNLYVQVQDIVNAWKWNSNTAMLNVLPLHHVHGFLYCLLSPLAAGGTVVMMPKFEPLEVWKFFVNFNNSTVSVNTFSAVPTVYTKLINKYEKFLEAASMKSDDVKERCLKHISLMASGSSALPDTVFHRWQQITGHTILERYGMSEIGMALSNPLVGKRIPGSVGTSVAEVQVRIAKPSSNENFEVLVESKSGKTTVNKEGEPGDLHIKGANVFKEYWMKSKATADSFTKDGWFKTGDVAVYEDNVYRLLGRASSDIIKTGGYKVSALDVERYLLEHEAIAECAVFGIPDEEWGEKMVAIYGVHENKVTSAPDLKEFLKKKLPTYSVPKIFKCINVIPRNVTGKVNKKELKKLFLDELQKQ